MLSEFPAETDPSKLVNEFGDPNPKKSVSDVKGIGGIYVGMDAFIQSPEFLAYVGKLTGIQGLRYDPHYYGAGTHENFHGAGLDPHYDFNIHPITHQHRRLNAIVYLNKDWDPAWKGSLALHSDPWDLAGDEITHFDIKFNRCVVFETTERSWHSVPLIEQPEKYRHLSRKSFTIYLYTDRREALEVAPAHGTVYVQSGLPEHIRAGHVLNGSDAEVIQSNIARRHSYLRQLYKREYQFSQTIADLQAEIDRLQAYGGLPLVGQAKVHRVIERAWMDGWVGARLAFELMPVQACTGLRVTAHRPADQPPLELTLCVGGERRTETVSGSFDIEVQCTMPAGTLVTVEMLLPQATVVPGIADQRVLSVLLDTITVIDDTGLVTRALNFLAFDMGDKRLK